MRFQLKLKFSLNSSENEKQNNLYSIDNNKIFSLY